MHCIEQGNWDLYVSRISDAGHCTIVDPTYGAHHMLPCARSRDPDATVGNQDVVHLPPSCTPIKFDPPPDIPSRTMILQQQLEDPIQVHTLYLNKEDYARRRSPKTTLRPSYAPYTLRVKASSQDKYHQPSETMDGQSDMHARCQDDGSRVPITRESATRSTATRSSPYPQPRLASQILSSSFRDPSASPLSAARWPQLTPVDSEELTQQASSNMTRNPPQESQSFSTGYIGTRAKYYWNREEKDTPRIYIEYHSGDRMRRLYPFSSQHNSLSNTTQARSPSVTST
ncbi:hypothetical protein BXZ70DRAFT_405878 [Cristinia sonorae]|uniref:Uncharacterized protein n=1 Tax=Cristinia sonorae TaxID=1940300 RepID=A0A8K0UY59_9AGAR|nr:hypothetical protein BXZ70DRAFT_405878 [Cristinia sonorae]